MFKVGAFFLELMNFQIETVRRISFPFGQRPKQTLLTYGNPSMLIRFHTFVVERERSPCTQISRSNFGFVQRTSFASSQRRNESGKWREEDRGHKSFEAQQPPPSFFFLLWVLRYNVLCMVIYEILHRTSFSTSSSSVSLVLCTFEVTNSDGIRLTEF